MPKLSCSVLITGSEILDGRVVDTNSHFLIESLNSFGLQLDRIVTCSDDLSELVSCLAFLTKKSQITIITGGLGPTSDDLTRDLVAEWLGTTLEERAEAVSHIKEHYKKFGRDFDDSNNRQAFFPIGAKTIHNPNGTALGFYALKILDDKERIVFALPGVPAELRPMLQNSVWPTILTTLDLKETSKQERLEFVIFGLPEAQVGIRVNQLSLPKSIATSYRAKFPEIHLALKYTTKELGIRDLNYLKAQVIAAIGDDYVVSNSFEEPIEVVIKKLLADSKASLSAAESCTGGLLGEMITGVPGCSKIFLGSAVTYSNEAKIKLLSVQEETIRNFGAVSFETACEMAFGAQTLFNSSYALSITGVAGPDGGSEEKPAGTFFVGISSKKETKSYKVFYPSSRNRVRKYAAFTALDILRRTLLGFKVPFDVYKDH